MGVLTNWLNQVVPGFEMPETTFDLTFVTVGNAKTLHVQHDGCKPARQPSASTRLNTVVVDAAAFDERELCWNCRQRMSRSVIEMVLSKHPAGDIGRLGPLLGLHAETLDASTPNKLVLEAVAAASAAEPLTVRLAGCADEFSQQLAAAAQAQIDRVHALTSSDHVRATASIVRALVPYVGIPDGMFDGLWTTPDTHVTAAFELLSAVVDACSGDLEAACFEALAAHGGRRLSRAQTSSGVKGWLAEVPYCALVEYLDPTSEEPAPDQLADRWPQLLAPLAAKIAAHDAPLLADWIRYQVSEAAATPPAVAVTCVSRDAADAVRLLLVWSPAGLVWRTLSEPGDISPSFVVAGSSALVEGVVEYAHGKSRSSGSTGWRHLAADADPAAVADAVVSLHPAMRDDFDGLLDTAVQLCAPISM